MLDSSSTTRILATSPPLADWTERLYGGGREGGLGCRGPAAESGHGERREHEQREGLRQSDLVGEDPDHRRPDNEARVAERERRRQRRARPLVPPCSAEQQRHGVGDPEAAER